MVSDTFERFICSAVFREENNTKFYFSFRCVGMKIVTDSLGGFCEFLAWKS
jgi:hypothetical protein